MVATKMKSLRSTYQAMNDRQLITAIKTTSNSDKVREMRHVLYARYERFVHKHWQSLARRMNHSAAVLSVKNDFYAESYIVFEKALNAVKLSKIKDDKWKFLGYYGFYLSTLKNRFANGVVEKYNNETTLEVPSDVTGGKSVILSDLAESGQVESAEEEIIRKDHQRRFWSALAHCQATLWSKDKNVIWERRANGVSIKDTCSELGISTWKFNKILTEMKSELDRCIDRL